MKTKQIPKFSYKLSDVVVEMNSFSLTVFTSAAIVLLGF